MGFFISLLDDDRKPCGQNGCCAVEKLTTLTEKNSQGQIKNYSSTHYCLLNEDEEHLLEHVLDAYVKYQGSQDQMAQSLAEKFHTDRRKMQILCQTLCQLIERKIE